jgi:NADPH:quinone reductase
MTLPSTVQAITIAKVGDLDVIEKTAIPLAVLGLGDIVVKIACGGVNFIETY